MTLNRRSFIRTSLGAGAGFGLSSLIDLRAAHPARVHLVTRGDDLGCARSLNRAMRECLDSGILKNCSVIAPSPFIAEGAKLLAAERNLCFGLHCALTSEWDNVRWTPVLPKQQVPSLVDKDGYLHQTNEAVWATARADEALLELQAQLERARSLGFDIRYADMHMGTVARVPGLPDRWKEWCRQQRIIDTSTIGRRLPLQQNMNSDDRSIQGDYVAQVVQALSIAEPGEYLIVAHPGYDDAEIRNLGHPGYPGSAVANNLNWQRLAFIDPRVLKACLDFGVEPVRYDETASGRAQLAAMSASIDAIPPGFTPIFNGTDLSGWHISRTNHHGTTPDWRVINGVLTGTQQPAGRGGILLTDKRYGDFELHLELRPDWGCDGGLFLRSNEAGRAYQVMLDYLPGGSVGGIYGEGMRDLVKAPPVENWQQHWRREEWNSLRVRIVGETPHITLWMNGAQIYDWTDTANHTADGATDGMIAVQVHGGRRWTDGGFHRFRNIAVRELAR